MKTLSAEDFDFAALLIGEYGGEFGQKDDERVARIVAWLQQQAKAAQDRELRDGIAAEHGISRAMAAKVVSRLKKGA